MNDLTPFDPRPVVSAAQGEVLAQTREAYKVLYAQLLTLPPSRERAVALTELETSSMWAAKAVTHSRPADTTATTPFVRGLNVTTPAQHETAPASTEAVVQVNRYFKDVGDGGSRTVTITGTAQDVSTIETAMFTAAPRS